MPRFSSGWRTWVTSKGRHSAMCPDSTVPAGCKLIRGRTWANIEVSNMVVA